VLLGQDVAQEKKALLVELLAINFADRLIAGQAAVVECSSHVLPLPVFGWAAIREARNMRGAAETRRS